MRWVESIMYLEKMSWNLAYNFP